MSLLEEVEKNKEKANIDINVPAWVTQKVMLSTYEIASIIPLYRMKLQNMKPVKPVPREPRLQAESVAPKEGAGKVQRKKKPGRTDKNQLKS